MTLLAFRSTDQAPQLNSRAAIIVVDVITESVSCPVARMLINIDIVGYIVR